MGNHQWWKQNFTAERCSWQSTIFMFHEKKQNLLRNKHRNYPRCNEALPLGKLSLRQSQCYHLVKKTVITITRPVAALFRLLLGSTSWKRNNTGSLTSFIFLSKMIIWKFKHLLKWQFNDFVRGNFNISITSLKS